MNNGVFVKTMKMCQNKVRRNYLVLQPNYHATKIYSDNLLAIESKRTRINIGLFIKIYNNL